MNYAIALKYSGREAQAYELLATVDWSAKSPEFKLANEVLHERYDQAAALMQTLTPEQVPDVSYYDWPVFREFRGTPQFMKSYYAVFKKDFGADVQKSISSAVTNAHESVVESNGPA